jgi:hypothetical protein
MPTIRRPKPSKTYRSAEEFEDHEFEDHVTATLEAQDRMLERLEQKLEKPVLNGGFDNLVAKVEKIEAVSEQLREGQAGLTKKVDAIHVAVYDPDTGLYQKVKSNSKWIEVTGKGAKWFGGLVVAGLLTGAGKLLYDFVSGHIHITP